MVPRYNETAFWIRCNKIQFQIKCNETLCLKGSMKQCQGFIFKFLGGRLSLLGRACILVTRVYAEIWIAARKARQGKEDPALPRHYTPFLLDRSDLRCITRNCEHIAGICLILATRRKGFPPSKHLKGSSRECVRLPNLLNSFNLKICKCKKTAHI